MRVFVTGASGWVGSVVVVELLRGGHEVLGLARSDASGAAIEALGADVLRGTLEDHDVLREGARATNGVIHTAFIHDFSRFDAAAEVDRGAIEAIGDALVDTDRPFIVTAGLPVLGKELPTENDRVESTPGYPRVSEATAMGYADRGVRVIVMRLPPSVYGKGDHGFVPALIENARQRCVAAYVGEGTNKWASVHRLDAAPLYRLALESAPAGIAVHAVANTGTPMREIAAVIGRGLDVPVASVSPEDASEALGWLAPFASTNLTASNALTRERFGWSPQQPGLLEEMTSSYFTSPIAT